MTSAIFAARATRADKIAVILYWGFRNDKRSLGEMQNNHKINSLYYDWLLDELEKELDAIDPTLVEWSRDFFAVSRIRYISDLNMVGEYYEKGRIL